MNLHDTLSLPEIFLHQDPETQNDILRENGIVRDSQEQLLSVWTAYEIVYRSEYLASNDVCIALSPYRDTNYRNTKVTVKGNGEITLNDKKVAYSATEISSGMKAITYGAVLYQYPAYPNGETWIFAGYFGPYTWYALEMEDVLKKFPSR